MIAADDPRHGRPSGYMAGCKEPCCTVPRARQHKRAALRRARGISSYATAEQVTEVVAPWLAMGISVNALRLASGVANHAFLEGHRVRLTTFQRLAVITEADLPRTSLVYADLTRRRVFSLMAIGHQLKDMPLHIRGTWRTRDYVNVGLADDIRAYYRAHEFQVGPSIHTANRARNAGHLPPLAWDDPGTLAWPQPATVEQDDDLVEPCDVDEAVVLRVLAGDVLPTTPAERRTIMARWLELGRSEKALCERMHWKAARYTPAALAQREAS